MSREDLLKQLVSERKWFDLSELITEWCNDPSFAANSELLLETLSKNMAKIHPLSLTSTIGTLFYHISPETALGIIDKAVSMLEVDTPGENPYFQEIVTLKLFYYIALLKLGRYEDIESRILSLKAANLSNDNMYMLYIVSALFYEGVGNYDEAQSYLFLHAKQTGHVYDIGKLVELSIRSTTFFDFSAIFVLPEFSRLQNAPLKNLFLSLSNGDMNSIDPQEIANVLHIKDASQIVTKIHLLNIIRICFKSEQKSIGFDRLMAELNVDEATLIKLLLRALGLQIVKGWIDSEVRTLFFDSVLPRALEADELQKMKMKFVEWRNRVANVIEMVERQ